MCEAKGDFPRCKSSSEPLSPPPRPEAHEERLYTLIVFPLGVYLLFYARPRCTQYYSVAVAVRLAIGSGSPVTTLVSPVIGQHPTARTGANV